MDDRSGVSARLLGEVLAGGGRLHGGRPARPAEQRRDFPVPPFEPERGVDTIKQFLEKLEFDRKMQEFMDQVQKRGRRDA